LRISKPIPSPSGPQSDELRPAPENAAFLRHVEQLDADAGGLRGLHLGLSELQPQHRREQHVRAAVAGFERLVSRSRGTLFLLSNLDIVFLYDSEAEAAVERQLQEVAFLFGDDPLFVEAGGPDAFSARYDLESERDGLIARVQRSLAKTEAGVLPADGNRDPRAGTGHGAGPEIALAPEQLGKLARALTTTDLSSLVRRQSVCTFGPRRNPLPRFVELYVSISDLRDAVLPGVDLQSNRWLFQYLTEILDLLILRLLGRSEQRTHHEILSININVSTLLSDTFRKFDQGLNVSRNGSFIFELQGIDILADVGAFLSVRDSVRKMGHRLCLDGISYREIDLYDRIHLGVDFVKIVWDPDMLRLHRRDTDRLAAMVRRCDPARLVLCRVDSTEAVEFGERSGITLFQGRHIERLLSEATALERRSALLSSPEEAA
jgi:EAL domain-containing protein (putative c-di-GMP-specific phosphodiesterase class I)